MNRPIRLAEAVVSILLFFGGLLSVYLTLRDDSIKAQLRLDQLEVNYKKIELYQDKVDLKLDAIRNEQMQQRVLLENKQNR